MIAYIGGIVLASVALFNRSTAARKIASVAWVVAWFAHLAAIVAFVVREDRLPLASMGEYLLTLGWVVLTLHLFLWFRQRMDVAGLVLPPIAVLARFAAWGLLSTGPARSVVPQRMFLFHTSVSTLGMALLCVAFAMSLLYLLQDRALKQRKKLRLIERLPALSKCDQIGFHSMLVGFILLSIGIGTGVMVTTTTHHRLFVPDSKGIFAVLAWGVFAALLVSRRLMGFRGRKSAYLTIAGFALGLMTVLGMTL
jgi:ABC-type uncharacterized transport system permease subunit